jgi:GNAT superfamily N-acetyltransferase
MILLVDLICEDPSLAAQQAHEKGWVSGGWGTWQDSSGKTVGKTIQGKLVPISQVKDYEEEEDIEDFSQSIRDTYRPAKFEVYIVPNTGDIHLASIVVRKDQHGQGIGTKIMDDLLAYADAHGRRVTLTPMEKNSEYGTTSSARLQKFYKRFGFVPNKGKHKDFRTRDSMIRPAKPLREASRSNRSVWRVDSEDSSVVSYGARNTAGDVRYFDKEEKARKFAGGQIKGPSPGRPEPKQKAEPKERKQTYRTRNE